MQLAPFHGRSPHSRRAFLSSTVKAAALVESMGLRTGSQAVAQQKGGQNRGPRIHVFSKHLQWLDYRGMAEAAAEIGFDGVDLTVRPRGHVLPERVEDDLPRAVEAVRQAGLRVEMIIQYHGGEGLSLGQATPGVVHRKCASGPGHGRFPQIRHTGQTTENRRASVPSP